MRRLALAVVLLLTLLTTACTMWPEKKNPTWKSATSAEQLNRLLWDGISAQKWDDIRDRFASTAVYNDSHVSISGRDAILDHLKKQTIGAVQIGEVQSQPAGADLVSTYIVQMEGRGAMRAMTVWQEAGNRWVIVAHSVTTVP